MHTFKIKNFNWTLIISFLVWAQSFSLAAQDTYPAPLTMLDKFFSHHVIVAEKSTHTLYIFKNVDKKPQLIKTFKMATGKKAGDKFFQGDHRTPEGIYYLTQFLTHQDLLKRNGKQGEIYGVGAFVLNYPNPLDKLDGKTGGGIWLHSTNDETRIEKGLDSRGCIVTANSHLIDISHYIELQRTPIVVVHELTYLSKKTWQKRRYKINSTIQSWLSSWESENHEEYMATYHKSFFDPIKGSRSALARYKKGVFAHPGKPEVKISNLSILTGGEYAMATFKQNYKSNTIEDMGRKTLYLKQDEYYNWKIVAERWSKHGIDSIEKDTQDSNDKSPQVAFEPSNRFFETLNPKKILGERLLSSKSNTDEQAQQEEVNP